MWVTHMKTTLEIQDDLLERIRGVARREGTTLRALVEEGLRLALRARAPRRRAGFQLKPFHGDGFTDEFANASWQQIRDEIYEGSPVPATRER